MQKMFRLIFIAYIIELNILGSVSYMNDSNQQIIFTNSEPSFAMIYDTKTGLHSVYKIRKASAEECQIVCGSNDTMSLFNHSTMSPLNVGSNLSINKSYTNKGPLSPFLFGKEISTFAKIYICMYMKKLKFS